MKNATILLFLLLLCCSGCLLDSIVHAQGTAAQSQQQQQEERERRRQERRQKRAQERQQTREERRKDWSSDGSDGNRNGEYYYHKSDSGSGSDDENSSYNFNDAYEGLGAVFPTQAPKDIIEGSLRGMQHALIGGVTGLAACLGIPFAMAKSDLGYLWGISLGGLIGVLSGGTAVIVGTASGLYQFVLGVKNTPRTLWATWKGEEWNPETKTWETYRLAQEAEELLSSPFSSSSHQGSNQRNNSRRVQDTTMYDLLEVDSSATGKEIKKAYFAKAKQYHPDKNPDDESANEKFLQIHKAYQTLSDEQSRAAYDNYGTSSSSSFSTSNGTTFYFNVEVFFEVLFGLQPEVEFYVGTLTVSSFVRQLMDLYRFSSGGTQLTKELWTRLRQASRHATRQRYVEIATNLHKRIDAFATTSRESVTETTFRASCATEASRIDESLVFGDRFLEMIGTSLVLEGATYINFRRVVVGWPASFMLMLRRRHHKWGGRIKSWRKTWNAVADFMAQREQQEDDEGTENSKKEQERMQQQKITSETIEAVLPALLEMAWAHIAYDIALTLEAACQKLLRDADASADTKRRRARALVILGEEFLHQAHKSSKSTQGSSQGDQQDKNGTCDDPEVESEKVKARLDVAYHLATMEGTRSSGQEWEEMIQKRSATRAEKQEQ